MIKKILAVDDDPGTREFYKLAFEEAGFTVETAGDATAAIIICGDFAPDMLLSEEDTRKIPVLVLTGSHFNASTENLFRQEGNVKGFLSKTTPIDLIVSAVKLVLTL